MEQIIASHVVKPSSPTPIHHKIHKLSSLDQFVPPIYVPLIFFYQAHQSHQQIISLRLRRSLSEILTVFYPLAGTLKNISFIDCDDGGVKFVEAKVDAELGRFTRDPKMEELKQLIPISSIPHQDDLLFSVKVSYFGCGGVAVGACFSHKISDASSCAMFMNAWAANCRGEASGIIHPSFDLALHFPPVQLSSSSRSEIGVTEAEMVTKRMVFKREELEKIKQQVAATSEEVKDPSTVEAFSVFIWRSFIEAHKAKLGAKRTTSFVASHVVNLRPRTLPPIADDTFGNCAVVTSAVVSREEDERASGGAHLSKIRAAIARIDGDYIDNVIKDGEKYARSLENIGEMFGPENCFFSSWWRFPVYEVDFGWGKPVWACTATMAYMNGIILMSTPSRDGIEMWITLPDEDFFRLFEANCNKLLHL